MKLENFSYIDRAGAWAVVAFTLVAGLMVFDSAQYLFNPQWHKPAPEVSQPPSHDPAREKEQKPTKPLRIPDPRSIG